MFISYARKDGEALALSLGERLKDSDPEVSAWLDRAEMEGGLGWWKQIEEAIDKVTFLVIVMTPAALLSEVARREWRYARQKGVVVYPVKGVPDSELNFNTLPKWMRKAHFVDLEKEWETFTRSLKSDPQPARVPFMAPELPKGVVQRPREHEALLNLFLNPDRSQPQPITATLHGGGGYGKTTIAKLLCHDDRVIEAFDDGILWVTLGRSPNVKSHLAEAYKALTGKDGGFADAEEGARELEKKLEHRDCLIVVDDVWDPADAEPFLRGGPQSARLLTTRALDVTLGTARVVVDKMTSQESVAVLVAAFNTNPSGSETAGATPKAGLQTLARRLGEWPLLLRLAASMLQKRRAVGESPERALTRIGEMLDRFGVTAFDNTNASARERAVSLTVAASRDLLSAEDKRCLGELAIFREDAQVPLTTLARLWRFDDFDAERCAQRLDEIALITLDLGNGTVSLHDMLRSFLLREIGETRHLHARLVSAYGDLSQLPDAYAWRSLSYHLAQAGQQDQLRQLLLDPQWLRAKLAATDVHSLLQDFEQATNDPDLGAVRHSLRLSLPVLAADPDQFAEQLRARVSPGVSPRLDELRDRSIHLPPHPRLHVRWSCLARSGFDLLETLVGHSQPVDGVQVLDDGRLLSWSRDCTLRVWNLTDGSQRILRGHSGHVEGVRFLTDGRVLSWSGSDATMRVWDLDSAEAVDLVGHEGGVLGAQPLDNERILSWGGDRTLRLWNLATRESQVLARHERLARGAQILADGRILSWGADELLLSELRSGQQQPALTVASEGVGFVHTLDERHVLAWCDDWSLRIYDLSDGKAAPLSLTEQLMKGARSTKDGRVLVWGESSAINVWDITLKTAQTLLGHRSFVKGVDVLEDGRVLSWGDDGTVRLWDLATSASEELIRHDDSVLGALIREHGARVVSWSRDGTLRVWDAATRAVQVLRGHEGAIGGAVTLSDERILSWGSDRRLRLWRVVADTGPTSMATGGQIDVAVALGPQRVVTWSRSGPVRTWDLSTGAARDLASQEEWTEEALSFDERAVVCRSRLGTVRLWDPSTDTELLRIDEGVSGMRLLPDRRVLLWDDTAAVYVLDAATCKVRTLIEPDRRGYGTALNGAQWTADGRLLSWGLPGLRVWDLRTGSPRLLFHHEEWVDGALLLTNSTLLFWGTQCAARVLNLHNGEAALLSELDPGSLEGAALLPDGRVLSWHHSSVRVWDVASNAVQLLTGHEDSVEGMLHIGDSWVASWSADRSVRVWDLTTSAQLMRFDFDAKPTAVVGLPDGLFVGDNLGGTHFLEWPV